MGAVADVTWNSGNAGMWSSIVLVCLLSYIAGRLHQFYRTTEERDLAYRDGYNTATRSLFSLATRSARGIVAPPMLDKPERQPLPSPKPIRASAKVGGGRHSAGDGKSTLQQTKVMTAWDKYKQAS